jgi:hypothetical protein
MTQQQLTRQPSQTTPTPQPQPPTTTPTTPTTTTTGGGAPSRPRWKTEQIGLRSIGSASKPTEPTPDLSLAQQTAEKYGDAGTTYGEHSSRERETETTYSGSGTPNGTSTTTKLGASKGELHQSERSSTTIGGDGAIISSKVSSNTLKGAEAKLETLARISDDELRAAVEMLARAGAFGSGSAEIQRRLGVASVGAKAQGSGSAGVQGNLSGSAVIDRTSRLPQIAAAIEGAIKAGVWAEGSVEATAKLHPFSFMGPIAFLVAAKIEAWAGAQASFKASVFATAKEGIGASLEGSAKAGAGAEGSVNAALDLGPLGFDVSAQAAAFAGVEAKFAGGFHVSLTGISAKFEASAFAGAKASIGGSAGIRIRGRKVVDIKGEIEVYAGVGGKAKGSFSAGGRMDGQKGTYSDPKKTETSAYGAKDPDDGKVKAPFEIDKSGTLKFGTALGGALGIGAGIELEAEVDFVGIGEAIITGITELGRTSDDVAHDRIGPDFTREALAPGDEMGERMRRKGYNAVYESFKDYAETKAVKGKNGVKRERVQAILDNINPTLRPYFAYLETDKGMTDAAKDAFSGQVGTVEIEAGQIKKWVDVSAAEVTDFKQRMQTEEGWRKTRDKLRNAFAAYASKKESKGTEGVKREKVQAIISEHWDEIVAKFGLTDAPELVSYAAELSRIDRYFPNGTLSVGSDGKLTEGPSSVDDVVLTADPNTPVGAVASFTSSKSNAARIKADHANAVAMKAMLADINNLEQDLKQYLAKGVSSSDFTMAGVSKIFAKHAANMKAGTPGLDALLSGIVTASLGETVSDVSVTDLKLSLKFWPDKVSTVTTPADEAAKQKVIAAVGGYLTKKTGQGDSGVKITVLNEHLRKSTSAIAKARDAGSRDGEIRAWVEQALAPVQGAVRVEKGVIVMLSTPGMAAAKTKAKQSPAPESGTKILNGGSQLDNHRRSMVMGKIREPLEKYRLAHMKAYVKAPTTAKLDKAKLQGVIDKVKSIKDDVAGVADAEILAALLRAFPTLDPAGTSVDALVLTMAEKPLVKDDQAAKTKLTDDIRSHGIMARDAKSLQLIVERYKVLFASTGVALDALIKTAVSAAFDPDTIATIEVAEGKVKKFKLKGK